MWVPNSKWKCHMLCFLRQQKCQIIHQDVSINIYFVVEKNIATDIMLAVNYTSFNSTACTRLVWTVWESVVWYSVARYFHLIYLSDSVILNQKAKCFCFWYSSSPQHYRTQDKVRRYPHFLHKYIYNKVSENLYQSLSCRILLKDEAIKPMDSQNRKQHERAAACNHAAGISCGHYVQYKTNRTVKKTKCRDILTDCHRIIES